MKKFISAFWGTMLSASLLVYLMLIHGGYLFIYLLIIFYVIYFVVLLSSALSKKRRAKHPYVYVKIIFWTLLLSTVYLFQDLKLSMMEAKANEVVATITLFAEQYGRYPTKEELENQSKLFKYYDNRKIMSYALLPADHQSAVSFMYKSPLNSFDRFFLNLDMKTWVFFED